MARRLIGLAAIAAAAVVSASGSFASSTPTRHFYRVSWNVPVAVNGRHPLSMRISWLLLSRTTWSVRVQVVNRSDHTLRPIRNGKTGWGLVWAKSYPYERHQQCSPPTCGLAEAASFEPALPRILRPGEQWSGLYSGRGHVPENRWVSFALGYYRGWPRYAGGSGFGIGPTLRGLHVG